MSAVATRSYTVEECLELDADADDECYELQHGSVISKAGAELEHTIRSKITFLLNSEYVSSRRGAGS
ncbi:hypothetical protein BSZ35_15665 [Salinibacter sp. 10B]|nr:hypothetical protein BSZ35_15665 [Salinibacter sp. 10B]